MVVWDRGCGTSSWIHDTEKQCVYAEMYSGE